MISLNDQGTVDALKNCGLLKLFRLSNMWQQMELLHCIVRAWCYLKIKPWKATDQEDLK